MLNSMLKFAFPVLDWKDPILTSLVKKTPSWYLYVTEKISQGLVAET